MPDGHRRSREHWTDTMEADPEHPPAHIHRLPPVVRLAIVGLTAAVFLLAIALGLVSVYVYQANQYMQGRGEFRDREAARIQAESEEDTRETACAILDGLPASPLLDNLRDRFGCGPGIPLEELPPEVQQQLNGGVEPTVRQQPATVSPAPEPEPMGGAVPGLPRAAPAEPSQQPPTEPEASPTPQPAPDAPPTPGGLLDPITDPLCTSLGICL